MEYLFGLLPDLNLLSIREVVIMKEYAEPGEIGSKHSCAGHMGHRRRFEHYCILRGAATALDFVS